MRRPRVSLAACCVTLGVCGVAAPAVALGDGSAGDQQYTDPFSGGSSGGGGSTTPPTTTPTQTAPAPSTQTAPAPAPTATAPAATAPSATTPAPQSSSTSPLATVAAPSSGQTLPYTGYADWTVAGFGVTLLAGGLVLRRRTAA